jgi:hypothetical protein
MPARKTSRDEGRIADGQRDDRPPQSGKSRTVHRLDQPRLSQRRRDPVDQPATATGAPTKAIQNSSTSIGTPRMISI